jgi:predicted nuclease of predicted toxin-antitoxin system
VKLLLDQNISFRLIKRIELLFPDSQQVRRLGLNDRPDKEIWFFAKTNNYTVLTFDSDYLDLSMIYGQPPKLILLKSSNQTTDNIEMLLKLKFESIKTFILEGDLGCLEIGD